MDGGITKGRSAVAMNVDKFGGNREPALGALEFDDPVDAGNFSTFVIVRLAGTLLDALCLRRFVDGPCKSVGEVCLEKFRELKLAGVLADEFWDSATEPGDKG